MKPAKFSKKIILIGVASLLFLAILAIWWRFSTMTSPPQTEKSTWQRSRKKDSKIQRNVLELADRNSEEVSYTDKLLGHDLTNTLRLVWSKNLRRVQNREPKTE